MNTLKENTITSLQNMRFLNENSMVGQSPEFLKAIDIAQRVAKSNSNILIHGESGTGKELFARFIHNHGLHSKGPFVAINCSAIPENLLESELFGHARGSFTGATEKRIGLFEEAEDGTLFLDEIGDLNLSLQAKLLRVIQEKKIKRVGENIYRAINCRIICATNKNLSDEVNQLHFREDLFFRLNVIPITIPPLRHRQEDLLPLALFFLKKYAVENNSLCRSFSKEAIYFLLHNQWRGNVRELENSIERAVVLSSSEEIPLDCFLPSASYSLEEKEIPVSQSKNVFSFPSSAPVPTLDDVIRQYIAYAIQKNGGARDKTARQIGIDRKTLYKWIKSDFDVAPANNFVQ